MGWYRARSRRTVRLLGTLLFALPLLAATLAVAPALVLGAGNGTGTVQGHTVKGVRSANPPQLPAEQRAKLDAVVRNNTLPGAPIPEGQGVQHLTTKPTIPPLAGPPKALPANTTNRVGKQSARDFTLFQNNALPAGGSRSTQDEPSVAVHGAVVFITGNSYAAISVDRGNAFTFIDPVTFFPSASGGFCCNQEVIYDVNRDVWVWTLQYTKDSTGNTVRFATATTADVIDNTWKYYDFHANQVGGGATDVLDYPNIALSNNFVYYATNISCNACTTSTASVAIRLSLAELSAQVGTLTFAFHDDGFGMAPTQGAATTMYLVLHVSTTQLAVIPWPEASTAPSAAVNVSHASYSTAAHTCTAPDGHNPCAADDNRIKTAWIANGVIGALWDVAAGASGIGDFAYAYVQGVRIDAGTLGLIGDVALYATNVAYAFPSVGVDGRGDLGTTLMFAGNGYYPSSLVMISDAFNSDVFPGDIAYTRFGTGSADGWGLYLTARGADETGNTWVGVGYTVQGGAVEVRYLRWGRERDNPFAGKQALPAIWRQNLAEWALRNSLNSGFADFSFAFGTTTDIPLFCDWTGDGQRYPVLFRPSAAQFIFGESVSAPVSIGLTATFGSPTDIPLCGDWTGQGKETIGLFRPSTAEFILSNSNTAPNSDIQQVFGSPTDMPVVGDWDGNGTTTIGVYRPSRVEFILSNSGASPSVDYDFIFGTTGDMPIVGDWDRNGSQSVGVYRNGSWLYRNTLSTGPVDGSFNFGTTGDTGLIWR